MLGNGVGINSLDDMQNLAFASASGNRVGMIREAKRAIQGNIYGAGNVSLSNGQRHSQHGYGKKKKDSSSVNNSSNKFISGNAARSGMYPAA